ncbi:OLC1v1038067C1 [Oldenlandia corymbosa var. corymbosa]|uniref:OLC1v1038067C1 n=1 Tax=Oldenlandia corymbosa var. corymbosa TaxID=529605 RepID=A0AAV1CZK6_OLDCO|nr:OLC1v1038067C1 [Oldenlandia corymbosa var. corymbosa]
MGSMMMMTMKKVFIILSSVHSLFFLLILPVNSNLIPESFIHCLSSDHQFPSNTSILSVTYVTTNASYQSLLHSCVQNLRFLSSDTPKPLAIITALEYSHVQTAVTCSKSNGLQIRIRSGGHDFEGLSYRSQVPFVILDLRNLKSVSIDIEDGSAWVESGATLGELYYAIAEKSPVHGFPAGSYPGVGIGGHFSGGGVGYLVRKYGLAADNVIDALVVDVNGRILDKESMGSDLFWAIRGGGGGSFGVVLAWRIKLVQVPAVVTACKPIRTFEHGAIDLLHKWQYVQPKLSEKITSLPVSNRLGVEFNFLFLGRVEELLEMTEDEFPELQLRKEDCSEMSWIESVLFLSGYPGGNSIEILKNRAYNPFRVHLKLKTDLIHQPLPYEAFEGMRKWNTGVDSGSIFFQSYGGIMKRISESELPFPHRKVQYEILYLMGWMEGDKKDGEKSSSEKYIHQLGELYELMTPYVADNPRSAYVNSRDLDLGTNDVFGTTTYSKAENDWGLRYFKNNFRKLAIIKAEVDPTNFFNHQQSIPPLFVTHHNEL